MNQDRRDQIARATLNLVAEGGIENVSFRNVAEEVGLSLGMVQRHFASKDELLHHTMQYAVEQLEHRLKGQIPAKPKSAKAVLQTILSALLESEGEARSETIIWIASFTHAAIHPKFAPPLAAFYQSAQGSVAEIVRWGQTTNEFESSLNPLNTAINLLALADGLTLQRFIGTINQSQARELIQAHLKLLEPTERTPKRKSHSIKP